MVYVHTAWGCFRGVTCHAPTSYTHGLPELAFGVLAAINLATVAFVIATVASAMLAHEQKPRKRARRASAEAPDFSPDLRAAIVAICADGPIPAVGATSTGRRGAATQLASWVVRASVFRLGSASLSFLAAAVAATGQALLDHSYSNEVDGSSESDTVVIVRAVCVMLRRVVVGACGLEFLIRWLVSARSSNLSYRGSSSSSVCAGYMPRCTTNLCGGATGLIPYFWDAGVVGAAVAAELLLPPSILFVTLPAILALLRLPRCLSNVISWFAPATYGSPLAATAGALFPFGSYSSAVVWVLEAGLLCGLSVIGCSAFGGTDPYHFGNLRRAALSTWQIQTGDEWTAVLRASALGCQGAFSDGAYPGGYYGSNGEYSNTDFDGEAYGCRADSPKGAGFGAVLFAAAASLMGGLALPSVLVGLASIAYSKACKRQEADVVATQRYQRAMATLAEVEAEAGILTTSSSSEANEGREGEEGWWSDSREQVAYEIFTALGNVGSRCRCCCSCSNYSINNSSSGSVVPLESLLPVIDFILTELPPPKGTDAHNVGSLSLREKELLQGHGLERRWSWADFAGFLVEWRLTALHEDEHDHLKTTAKSSNGNAISSIDEEGNISDDNDGPGDEGTNRISKHDLIMSSASSSETGPLKSGGSADGLSQADFEATVQRTVAAALQDHKSAAAALHAKPEPGNTSVTSQDDKETAAEAASKTRVHALEAKAAALEAQLEKFTSSLNSEQQRLEEVRGKSLDARPFTVVTAEDEDSQQPRGVDGRGATNASTKPDQTREGQHMETAPVESADPSEMAWRTLLAGARKAANDKSKGGESKLSTGFNEAWAKDVGMVFLAFEDSSSSGNDNYAGGNDKGIAIKDLVKGLKTLGVKLSPPQATAFAESLDENGDGAVSLKEFMAAARWEMKKLETAASSSTVAAGNKSVNGPGQSAQSASMPRSGDHNSNDEVQRLRARSDALRARQQNSQALTPSAVPPWMGAASPKKVPSVGSGLSSMKFEERALPLPKAGSGRSGGSTSSTARATSPRRLMPGERRGSKGGAVAAEGSATTSPVAKGSATAKTARSKLSPAAKGSTTSKGSNFSPAASKLTPGKSSGSASLKGRATTSPSNSTGSNSQASCSGKFRGKGTATSTMRSPTGR